MPAFNFEMSRLIVSPETIISSINIVLPAASFIVINNFSFGGDENFICNVFEAGIGNISISETLNSGISDETGSQSVVFKSG